MKTISAIIIAIILLAMSISVGSVFAEGGGETGYPIETETTTVPTPEPTQPTPEPTQPTPEPTKPTPDPTKPRPVPTDEPEEPHPACTEGLIHPVITSIGEAYGLPYEELIVYFCEYDLGVGEIVLLVETYKRSKGEYTLDEILAMRLEQGLGWGEIWQILDLENFGKDMPGGFEGSGVFNRNQNRRKYNHQASNP